MTVYAPGTQEKDLTKLNISLQQNAAKNQANADNIAALQATAATVQSVATAGLATGGPITITGTVTVTAASKSDQTTGTSNAVAVTPLHQQDHASAAKAWVAFNSSGTILGSYNVTSVSRTATGKFTVTFTTAFANTNYAVQVSSENPGNSTDAINPYIDTVVPKATTTVSVNFLNAAASAFANPTVGHVVCYGAQ